jgi:hypothetical protein
LPSGSPPVHAHSSASHFTLRPHGMVASIPIPSPLGQRWLPVGTAKNYNHSGGNATVDKWSAHSCSDTCFARKKQLRFNQIFSRADAERVVSAEMLKLFSRLSNLLILICCAQMQLRRHITTSRTSIILLYLSLSLAHGQ